MEVGTAFRNSSAHCSKVNDFGCHFTTLRPFFLPPNSMSACSFLLKQCEFLKCALVHFWSTWYFLYTVLYIGTGSCERKTNHWKHTCEPTHNWFALNSKPDLLPKELCGWKKRDPALIESRQECSCSLYSDNYFCREGRAVRSADVPIIPYSVMEFFFLSEVCPI